MEELLYVRQIDQSLTPLLRWSVSLEVSMSIHGPASAFFPFSVAERAWKNQIRTHAQLEMGEISDMTSLSQLDLV